MKETLIKYVKHFQPADSPILNYFMKNNLEKFLMKI